MSRKDTFPNFPLWLSFMALCLSFVQRYTSRIVYVKILSKELTQMVDIHFWFLFLLPYVERVFGYLSGRRGKGSISGLWLLLYTMKCFVHIDTQLSEFNVTVPKNLRVWRISKSTSILQVRNYMYSTEGNNMKYAIIEHIS